MTVICAEAAPLLSAYFDRELDVATSVGIAAHLRECERCSAAVRRYEALRSSLSSASLVFTPPRSVERSVRKAVRREAGPRLFLARPWWRWAAVPLTACLAAALSWSVATRRVENADERVMADLVSGHVRSLMVDHLVDVATSDRHTVKPWFNGKVDFAPPVADFAASGFQLVGGRVDYIARRPVAVLVYKWKQHTVNVFIWRSEGAARAELRSLTHEGYQLVGWEQSGLSFWAVSDLNLLDLGKLVHLFRTGA
jgi:anti-sigma factor RsiW